ncbi:mitochondrial import receptor subunit Tom22-domain-containing protein [Lipomyces japonicus]|uniref:mitochondrial import receptor subunit Tom22-domain-containing protein n=1 Tax=Lipomyces japonicus TaxID=56871 RepID=UPI0034CEC66B
MVDITQISATNEEEIEQEYTEKDADYVDVSDSEDSVDEAVTQLSKAKDEANAEQAAYEDDGDDDDEQDDDDDLDEDYDDDLDDIENETIYDRILALKAIVPPRYWSTVSGTASSVRNVIDWSLKSVFVITTSALFVGAPLVILSEADASAAGAYAGSQEEFKASQEIIAGGKA